MDDDDPEESISDLERQTGLRRRWRLAYGTVELTDSNGVRWRVHRCWFPRRGVGLLDGDLGEATPIVLPAVWLPWFLAKWLGVRWIILTECNGGEVGEERVRGWRRSQRRIQEIGASVAAGTPGQGIVAELPTAMNLPSDMAVTPESWTKLTTEAKVTLWRMYNSGELRRH